MSARGGSGGGGGKKGGDGKSTAAPAAPPKIKDEVFLVVSMALSGRTPCNGSIMSLGAVAILADRTVVGVFSENMTLLKEAEGLPDVLAYWQSRSYELEVVCRNAAHPSVVFPRFVEFCKPFGKCTLVGSPVMSIYPFLLHYFGKFCPKLTTMPWGYSGVCARSFASGVLGVAVKDLAKHPGFIAACEGMDATGIPINDALLAATFYTNLWRQALKLDAKPLSWQCAMPPATMLGPISPPINAHPALSSDVPMPFCEYPSITDPDFDHSFSGDAPEAAKGVECDWVVTEKVHGTNFSIVTDGINLRAAKRTGLLTAADAKCFFGFDALLIALEDPIVRLFAFVREHIAPAAKFVAVFGELAGGEYHHADVPRSLLGRRVQHGVQYSPDNFFYGFDIAWTAADAPNGAEEQSDWHFLSFDEQQRAFGDAKILSAAPLYRGPLAGAVHYPCAFDSTIPKALGLPPVSVPNFAEGVVIRPVVDIRVAATDNKKSKRLMLKVKHPMFREFVTRPTKDMPLDEIAIGLINANRVQAVLSKHTAEEQRDTERMAKFVAADALKDALGAFGGDAGKFDQDELLRGLSQLSLSLVHDAVGHS